ncbi:MAG: alpha-hydroxy-acid oxidizing protein [Pseudomonadales bacterium]|nr:alpha-hydroxy-acid oxidizing protein [Pseudomonadales bacterium]
MSEFATLHEIIKAGRANLDKPTWDYLIGGADTETTLKRNRLGLDSLALLPTALGNVNDKQLSARLLGVGMRIPVLLPPLGSVQLFESGGCVSVARAAEAFGTLAFVSSVAEPDFETVAANSNASLIYQLYLMGDTGWLDSRIERAIAAGFVGLCLTIDMPQYSRRERDILKAYVPASGSQAGSEHYAFQSQASWQTVAHIKEQFDFPLILKGISTAQDAKRAVEAGVDMIYVSNHGGRVLDQGRGTIDALPEVVEAVQGRVPVVMDGGIMRGTDILKALCIGADAVGIGRLQAIAMSAGGVDALTRALELLEIEIDVNMGQMGLSHISELNAEKLVTAAPVNPPHLLSAFPLLDEGY